MKTEEIMLSREVECLSNTKMSLGFVDFDCYSVFLAELIAIEEALKYCVNESITTDIWILSDSRILIQRLAAWWELGDILTVHYVQHLNFL